MDHENPQRRHPRYEVRLAARYAHAVGELLLTEYLDAVVRDLSAGGCKLRTAVAEMPGTTVRVQIEVAAGQWVDVEGEIRWSEPGEIAPDGTVTQAASCGVLFTNEGDLPEALELLLFDCASETLLDPGLEHDAQEPLDLEAPPPRPPTVPPSAPPIATGNLGRNPAAQLIFFIYRKKFSGRLSVTGGLRADYYFRDGMPVYADQPDAPPDALCRSLYERGVLDGGRFAAVMSAMASSGLPEELVLVEHVGAEELAEARRQVLQRRVNLLFHSSDDFAIYAEDHAFATTAVEAEALRIHPRRAIYQGVRSWYGTGEMRDQLTAMFAGYFHVPADRVPTLDRYAFSIDDRQIADLLSSGSYSPEQLASASRCALDVVCMLLFTLHVTEALEHRAEAPAPQRPRVATPPPGAPPAPRQAIVTPVPSGASPAASAPPRSTYRPVVNPQVLAELRAKVEDKLKRYGSQDYFELLEVRQTATTPEIATAYKTALQRFDPARLAQQGLGHRAADLQALIAKLNEAHALLSDDRKRVAYVQALLGSGKGKAATAAPTTESDAHRGEAALAAGQFAEAEKHLKKAQQGTPSPRVDMLLAWARYKNPANDRAAITKEITNTLGRVWRRDAELKERALCYLGQIALDGKDPETAEKMYRRVLKDDPYNQEALQGLERAQAAGATTTLFGIKIRR